MPVNRRRFRIEQAFVGEMPMPAAMDGEAGPMHHEIMNELRSIRAQMATPGHNAAPGVAADAAQQIAESQALLGTYRAQIEQCEKLKVELDLIYDAINRTKREIAVLHGKSFDGNEMSKVTGELGAVVGGTEQATQQILESAEAIDQAASALAKVNSPDQHKILSEEISERVVSIFEATAKATIRGIFETNVFGVMNVMQAVIPHLRDHGGGTIVNITSGVGLAAVPLLALYTATKHAVEGLSESLSYELESQNILVKLVEPGAMRTTSFTANTMEASQAVSVPAKYKPYFDHMMRSMTNYPLPDADEEQVVATIHAAATDPSNRLRYLAGPDTEEMARLRWSTSEDEYLSTMNRLMGQTAWRDGNPG